MLKSKEAVISVKYIEYHLIGHGFHEKDKKKRMTNMTVVTDKEVEQFRETAITDVYRHGSESATAFVTSCTLTVASNAQCLVAGLSGKSKCQDSRS
jgi:hypothetical protein